MATKTPKRYQRIPARDFALSKGHYPINTPGRARSALARIAANGTPAQQQKVRRAVHRKYPNMAVSGIRKKLRGN